MITKYECECCGKQFRNSRECRIHEANHFAGIEKIKYELIHSHEENICDYCDHGYYVYGCEQNCSFDGCTFSNNYKYFIPVEPLHNKKKSGGI